MSRRARHVRPLGALPDTADITSRHMRTLVLLAMEEIPPELRARIAMKRPKVSWQDYDDARRQIAEHIVMRLREAVKCDYSGGSGATGGHG